MTEALNVNHNETMTGVMILLYQAVYFSQKKGEMHSVVVNPQLQGRNEAGVLLSRKLVEYRGANAIVVGVPLGGVCVASVVADQLALPLEVMPCRKIKDPANDHRCIGSVSANTVFTHDDWPAVPQDYISHQVLLLKNSIRHENDYYYRNRLRPSFLYKTVILVDDILSCSDDVMACLKEIKKQKPLRIVVAVPVVSAEAARVAKAEADDFVFLHMEPSITSPKHHYVHFPKVDMSRVKELLGGARKMVQV